MPRCQYCNELILWKKLKFNKLIPVEIEPLNVVESSNKEATIITSNGDVISGEIVGDANEQGYYIGYKPHYFRCPNSKR
jgi:hypothetical protein